jgi:hypothetical protein
MWRSFIPSDITQSIQESLDKAGDTITKTAQTIAKKPVQNVNIDEPSEEIDNTEENPQPLTDRLKKGWGTVLQVTRQVVQEAKEVVEKEQYRIAARLQDPDRPRRRDPSLALDVEALEDAEVVYITDRIITLSHPASQSAVDGSITPARKLSAIAHLLQKRHGGRFMLWNLSEIEYDVSIFDDQVLLFSFPGSPSPPLGLLLKLLISMESWLKADDRNVAVVHCLTGKGRTSTVVAAFLCWMGEAGFRSVYPALEYIARCKHCTTDELTIPSQRRYVQYFANMLDGVRPSQPPLILKRIIFSEPPRVSTIYHHVKKIFQMKVVVRITQLRASLQYAKGPPRDNLPPPPDDAKSDYDPEYLLMGCAPYLQIFKAGQLVFTTAATLHYNQAKDELPFCQVADGQVSFHVEIVIQGDILIRCRHLTSHGQRISMFRAAFHTGYVPPNVMRLTKEQLDGACRDKRFPDDFFVDLIFEPCVAEMASKHISGKADATESLEDISKTADTDSQNEASLRRERGTISGAANSSTVSPKSGDGAIVTASAYDSMLHRDSRFWDVIAARRQEHAQQESNTDTIDSTFGPTIGRRRRFEEPSNSGDARQESDVTSAASASSAIPMFSIGGGFESESRSLKQSESTKPSQEVNQPKERDELMDALNAIDDVESPIILRKARPPRTAEDVSTIENLPASDLFEEAKTCSDDSNPVPDNQPSILQSSQPQENQDANEMPESNSVNSAIQEATALLGLTDLTEDMNDLLAAGEVADAETGDLDDFDFDDDDLNDLESFLTSK